MPAADASQATPRTTPQAALSDPPLRWAWIILALVAIIVVVIRIRLLDIPFERDEGEFATMGKMILDGIPPYAEAYNLKPPGIYLAYALVMGLFGESPTGVHIGLLLVNLLSALLLFAIVRRLGGVGRHNDDATTAAALSAAAFLALASMPKLLGLSAHATHFLLPPALAGVLVLLRNGDDPRSRLRLFAAGCLMSVSFLVKQPGIFFILLGALMVLRTRWKEFAWYGAGVALPVGVTLLWLWTAGVFDRFWFWVVTYALAYGAEVGVAEGLDTAWSLGSSVALPALAVWLIAAWGLYGLRTIAPSRHDRVFIVAFLAASILAVSMGFHFRRHYFVLLLPVVAVFFSLGLARLREQLKAYGRTRQFAGALVSIVAALAIGQIFYTGSDVYLLANGNDASRKMFGANPFVESPVIGEHVRRMTSEGDRIAIVGSEPQIYFYSGRLPATGYLYTYGIVEHHPYSAAMLAEMTAEIERARPAVIVFVQTPSSWLLLPESDLSIFTWFRDYRRREGYRLEGVVETTSSLETVAIWGEDAARHSPGTPNVVEIWHKPGP